MFLIAFSLKNTLKKIKIIRNKYLADKLKNIFQQILVKLTVKIHDE